MSLRIIFISFILLLTPIAALQAHEAHRNNAPDPVEQVGASGGSEQSTMSAQSGNMPDPHDEHAHKAAEDAETEKGFDLVDFLGRLHPAVVHFPVALFLVAALAEFIMIIRPSAGIGSSVRFLVWIGAAGGVAAATLGWFAGGFRLSDRSEILGLHRWTGTGIAAAGLVLALLSGAPANSRKRTIFRVGLGAIAVAILLQGYWGGELSRGPNHLGL